MYKKIDRCRYSEDKQPIGIESIEKYQSYIKAIISIINTTNKFLN